MIAQRQPDFHENQKLGWGELSFCCLSTPVSNALASVEVERFEQLESEFAHPYDYNNPDHEAVLNVLYNLTINKSYFSRAW